MPDLLPSRPFPHKNLLGIEDLAKEDILQILGRAEGYAIQNRSRNKKGTLLAGKTVVTMFFENSTRTRNSFQIAAQRLGADVVHFDQSTSSMQKGETITDTMRVFSAMQVDAFVVRHAQNGVPALLAPYASGPVLNAGDGARAHPTQALLDALTIRRHKGRLDGLTMAICGDVEHSRVARSNIRLMQKFGSKIRLFTPPAFAPKDLGELGVTVCSSMQEALSGADVVLMLRIQNERLAEGEFSMPAAAYHEAYGLAARKLAWAKPDAIVIHPLPMNRGVEIADEVADDPVRSVVFEQIEMGVAVRMACLDLLLTSRDTAS